MSTNQKLNIRFRLNEQKEKNGECPIYIRIYVDGKKVEIATTYSITNSQWDPKQLKARSTAPNAQLINAYLTKTRVLIEEHFLNFTARSEKCTAKDLKNKFLGIEEKATYKTIVQAFDLFQKYLSPKPEFQPTFGPPKPKLKWTANRLDLVELIYALHGSGAFNYGEADLKDICETLESSFQIQVGDLYRAFHDISIRKKEKMKFVNRLGEFLERKVEELEL